MKKEIAVVYMVAGLSKRFGGKLKWLSKVGPEGESLIEYSIKQAIPSGITKIVFIVGKKTEKPFKEEFGDNYKGTPIHYALQTYNSAERNRPWGTLDALCSAKHLLDCPFIICSGDDLYGTNSFKLLVEHLRNKTTNATVGFRLKNVLSEKGGVNRGTFKIDSKNNVASIKEVFEITKENLESKGLTENTLCSMLFFGLHTETLQLLEKSLIEIKEKNKGDREIEALLPNEMGKLLQENKTTMYAYPTTEKWFGLTNPEDEERVKQKLAFSKSS